MPNVFLYINAGGADGPRGLNSYITANGWRATLAEMIRKRGSFQADGWVVSRPWGDEIDAVFRLDSYAGSLAELGATNKALSVVDFRYFCKGLALELRARRAPTDRPYVYIGGALDWEGKTLSEAAAGIKKALSYLPENWCYPVIDTLGAHAAPFSTMFAEIAIRRFGKCGYEPRPALVSGFDQADDRLFGYSSGALWFGWRDVPEGPSMDFMQLADVSHRQMVQCTADDDTDWGDLPHVYEALQDGRDVVLESSLDPWPYGETAAALKVAAGV